MLRFVCVYDAANIRLYYIYAVVKSRVFYEKANVVLNYFFSRLYGRIVHTVSYPYNPEGALSVATQARKDTTATTYVSIYAYIPKNI